MMNSSRRGCILRMVCFTTPLRCFRTQGRLLSGELDGSIRPNVVSISSRMQAGSAFDYWGCHLGHPADVLLLPRMEDGGGGAGSASEHRGNLPPKETSTRRARGHTMAAIEPPKDPLAVVSSVASYLDEVSKWHIANRICRGQLLEFGLAQG